MDSPSATRTNTEETPLQILQNYCKTELLQVAARIPKGLISLAISDGIGCVAKKSIKRDVHTYDEAFGSLPDESSRRQPRETDDLSELRQNPMYPAFCELVDALRRLVQAYGQLQENPDEVQALLQTVERTQPDTYELIEQRPPGTVTITVSPQHQQAIDRLRRMGFEHDRAIGAFLVFGRDEQLAATYLSSNFH